MGQDDAPETPVAEVVDDNPEHFRPSPADLVIARPDDRTHVLTVLDRHDELAIVDRVGAKLNEKLFYSFKQAGTLVTELSVSGVMECVADLNNTGKVKIGIDRDVRPEWETELADTEWGGAVPHIVCTVYAREEVTGVGVNGTFSQPRKFKLTEKTAKFRRADGKYVPDDRIVDDPFARQKALNKAERNALRKLVPEFVAQTLIAMWLRDEAKVQRIKVGPDAGAMAALPAPLTDDRALAQQDQARKLWTQILDAAPGGLRVGLAPAAFNQYLTRAQHSHERLDDLLVFLEAKLEEARR